MHSNLFVVSETHQHSDDFFADYWSIMTDPAHFAAELTFTVLDLVILTPLALLAWALIKRLIARAIDREHHRIDREHGIEEHKQEACETCPKQTKTDGKC